MPESVDVVKTNPLDETPQHETPQPDAVSTFTPLEPLADQFDAALMVFPSGPLVQQLQLEPDMLSEPLDHLTDRTVPCPACGADSDGVDLFCIVCGEFLETGEEVGEEADENAGAAGGDQAVAPACGDCGADVAVEEIFCLSCGAVVA